MKKLIAMLLLLSLALSATVSNPSPKEGELVTFNTTFNTTNSEVGTFSWDLDIYSHPASCISNGTNMNCSISITIPIDSLDQLVNFEFTGSISGLVDSGTIHIQDMFITANTPAQVNVDTVLSVPIEVLWSDTTTPPNQSITINSTELGIYDLFLGAGYLSRNIHIPIVDSGIYQIDFTLVHGSVMKTSTKTIQIYGRTTGTITPKHINVLPDAYNETKEFPVNVNVDNTGNSPMTNAVLSISAFGSTKTYNCGIITAGNNCTNLFTMTLPANKEAGLYVMVAELDWENDDGTTDSISTNYNLVVDELKELEVEFEDLGNLDPETTYAQNITLTSNANTDMNLNFEVIDMIATLSQENMILKVGEEKNISITYITELLDSETKGTLKITGDYVQNYPINNTINNYEFDIIFPEVNWKADQSNYNFNLAVKNLNDINVLGNITAECPDDWTCTFVNTDLNITANQNISIPFTVTFQELLEPTHHIDFILSFRTINITERMNIDFELTNISYEPFKSYPIQNASMNKYYFLSGNDLVPKLDLIDFDGVEPIAVRDYLDSAWKVQLQDTTNVPSTCSVYVISDEDKTPFLLTEKYPQGLSGGYNAKAYLAIKFSKIQDSTCTFYLKWGDGKTVKYSVTVFDIAPSQEEINDQKVIESSAATQEKMDELYEIGKWLGWIIVIGAILYFGVDTYIKHKSEPVGKWGDQKTVHIGDTYEAPKKSILPFSFTNPFKKVTNGKEESSLSWLSRGDKTKFNTAHEQELQKDYDEINKLTKRLEKDE